MHRALIAIILLALAACETKTGGYIDSSYGTADFATPKGGYFDMTTEPGYREMTGSPTQ